jgi:8-oxo-dGTP pyrophosphatase MutT (NUDIX family)
MHKLFHLSQQAVIFNEENQILILKDNYENWLLPGGRVDERDENLFEGLKRELSEECNFNLIEIEDLIGTELSSKGKSFAVAHKCIVEDMSSLQLSGEHTEFKWINTGEAENYLFFKNIGKAISKKYNN